MGRPRGYKHTEASKQKMSASMKAAFSDGRLKHLAWANESVRNRPETIARLRRNAVSAGRARGAQLAVSDERLVLGQHFSNYRSRAKQLGVVFDFDLGAFEALVRRDCWYCGRGPRRTWRTYGCNQKVALLNGLDRLDNSVGYTVENVVTCCGPCNRAKHTQSVDDFLEMARLIAARHGANSSS